MTDPNRSLIHCVVLAAGASRRMGRSKVLLPFAGRTLVERAVEAALGTGVAATVVVLGFRAPEVEQLLRTVWPDRADLHLAVNPSYAQGLAGSLTTGLRTALALEPSPRAVVFCLADQPGVTSKTIGSLLDVYEAATDGKPAAVVPIHDGRRGNPVLIDRALFPELLTLTGDTGARAVLDRHAARTTAVAAGPEVLLDVDTAAEYARLISAERPSSEGRPIRP